MPNCNIYYSKEKVGLRESFGFSNSYYSKKKNNSWGYVSSCDIPKVSLYIGLVGEINTVREDKLFEIEKQFSEFASKWKKETGAFSTMLHITMNDNYLDIMAMGKEVIPFILKDLECEPNHWFVALKHLTKFDPISKEDLGDIEKMRQAWLEWGRKEKYI